MPTRPSPAARRARLLRRRLLAAVLVAGVLLLAVVVVAAGVRAVSERVDAARTPPPRVPPAGAAPGPSVEAWAERDSDQIGIPTVALAAYARAAARVAAEQPACGLGWTTLAGLGQVESDHGRFRDAVLGADGRSDPPIIGVPLDGGPGLAEIRDTDGGRLDGDPDYDRAVGPLQFIPETWSTWAADGDGDGAADPFDIDDAALGAARFLCRDDRDMTSVEGWAAGLRTYNRSGSYAEDVRRAAADYAERSLG